MTNTYNIVRDHYQAGVGDEAALLARLAAILDQMEPPLTAGKFAGFDQFHLGGLAATAELARRAGVTATMKVLDAGSGLGGPSRYLAETFGCHVTGVDLAPNYVAIANLLANRAGLASKTSYSSGSITALPFQDSVFDLVWTQHVVMNIPDRAGLYRELRRVLRPQGTFAFYDPFAPENGEPPHFPVPWAETPATSTLLTKAETLDALEAGGFLVTGFEDVSPLGLEWIAKQQQLLQNAPQSGPGLSLGLVAGPRLREMVINFGRNLAEGRVRLVMGLAIAR